MINKIKAYSQTINTPAFKKKFLVMAVGVFFMGFFLSFLINCNLGTDPCTFMNVTISGRLGILFGTWQLALNLVLLLLVIWRDKKLIGPGTVANMVCIGYIADFFRFVWSKVLPDTVFTDTVPRIIIFIVTLAGFIIACSFYMNADMGVAPYDAISVIISDQLLPNVPFKYVRIVFDVSVVIIGCIAGGAPNAGIIIMSFALGPTITFIGNILKKTIFKDL